MTKTITLILLTLSLVACGGEPFAASGETLAGAGGDAAEAGSAGAPVGGSETPAGGSSSVAGKPTGGSAGVPQGGHASLGGSSSGAASGGSPAGGAAGSSSAGAPAGGTAPVTCDFDVTRLTEALPATIVWQDFTYTNGALCVTCRDKPCGTIHVISWGVPQLLEDGRYQFLPNTERTNPSVNIGTNDGMCTKSTECGVNMSVSQLLVTVTKISGTWTVAKAEPTASAENNMCLTSAGFGNQYPATADLQSEFSKSLTGLKIPCK